MSSPADRFESYTRLLATESDAWHKLRTQAVGGEYDPMLLAAWLEAGRRCAAARSLAIDALLDSDPGVMHRPLSR